MSAKWSTASHRAWSPPSSAGKSDTPIALFSVLSPENRAADILTKILDYHAAEIPHIWIIDPYERQIFDCSGGQLIRPERHALATPLVDEIDFSAMFAEIEELTSPASRSPRP